MQVPTIKTKRNQRMVQEIFDGATLEEVGAKNGISRERVRQIFRRAYPHHDLRNRPRKNKLEQITWNCPQCGVQRTGYVYQKGFACKYHKEEYLLEVVILRWQGLSWKQIHQQLRPERDIDSFHRTAVRGIEARPYLEIPPRWKKINPIKARNQIENAKQRLAKLRNAQETESPTRTRYPISLTQ